MESEQQGQSSNQRNPGGEIRQHQGFVVLQNLAADGMRSEEKKTAADMRDDGIEPEFRDVRQRPKSEETAPEGGGFNEGDAEDGVAAKRRAPKARPSGTL